MAHSRRRMPYKLGLDKLEEVKPSSIKAKLTADEEKKLTKDMEKLYDQLLPTAESETKRQRFVQKLENLLNTEWPGHDIRVNVFGSSGNLLCTDESDGMSSSTWPCSPY
jgi:DNA polymerase sigma